MLLNNSWNRPHKLPDNLYKITKKMNHKLIAIIETLILLGIVGALIIYLIFNGSSVGNVSFITGK